MDYRAKADEIFKEFIWKPALLESYFIDADDYGDFLNEYNISCDGDYIGMLSNQLEAGVKNGYSVEKQIEIIKNYIPLLFK